MSISSDFLLRLR